ncbi:hypothetical protein RUM43_013085 [Polyplax serrata]|uniref:Uncharacterized protein n=1 Tax=Polyplax serrata TaxID=468196 RepID=A0AAN8S774_POLSC
MYRTPELSSSPSPQKGRKMTIIEKGPSKVQTPSPGEPRSGYIKTELRKELRSPEMVEKSGRRDSDLISTATSALRRLHFRSAGGSRPKRGLYLNLRKSVLLSRN